MNSEKKKQNRKRKSRTKKLSSDTDTDTKQKLKQKPPHPDVGPQNYKDTSRQQGEIAKDSSRHDYSKEDKSLQNQRELSPKRDRAKKRKPSKDLKEVPTSASASANLEEGRPRYSFQVDDTDHCETPMQAYKDLLDVLDRIAKSLNKKRSNLIIYDPYYCDGGVKKKLFSYGFTSVINRNRDFYEDIKKNNTPEYDVLITNPPYSGVHMEKLLEFCSKIAQLGKPFLLLLPHFVYTKDYYQRALSSKVSSDVFFLVPEIRYSYFPPTWVEAKTGSKALEQGRNKTAPFPSFWYISTPAKIIPPRWLVDNFGTSGMVRPKHHSKLRYAKSTQDIPRDFRGEFDPLKKRSNPKARKRAAKRRREAAMKSGGGR